MLTLAEIESTQQFNYELRLEAFGEDALRELLADAAALRRLVPRHMSDAEGRSLAEATLAELIARKAVDPEPPAPSEPQAAWAQLLTLFWIPFR
jgi:hypothetical protein